MQSIIMHCSLEGQCNWGLCLLVYASLVLFSVCKTVLIDDVDWISLECELLIPNQWSRDILQMIGNLPTTGYN